MTAGSLAKPARARRNPLPVSHASLMALEPRMLFDGAIGVTADAAVEGYDNTARAETVVEVKTTPAPVNQAPVANPDQREAGSDSGPLTGNVITGAAPGDVADYDPDGDAFAVFGVIAGNQPEVPLGNVGTPVQGEHGSLLMYDDGSYRYTPDASVMDLAPGESVTDQFSYLVCDDFGNISTTTLTVTFSNPDNTAPTPTPTPTPVEPPVDVAPPAPQPVLPVPEPPGGSTDPGAGSVLPLPPTTDNGLRDFGDPFAARGSDSPLDAGAAPFTLLSAASGQPTAVNNGDAFSPFGPAAVLGMVETSPDRDARMSKLPVSSSKDGEPVGEQSAAEPADKPVAVKRSTVLAHVQADQPTAGRFSDTIRDNARQVAPLQKDRELSAPKR